MLPSHHFVNVSANPRAHMIPYSNHQQQPHAETFPNPEAMKGLAGLHELSSTDDCHWAGTQSS